MVNSRDLTAKAKNRLSRREQEVFGLAMMGLSDEQIAQRLGLAPSTVSSYWVRIRGKVGFKSRTELVADALRDESDAKIAELVGENRRLQQQVQEPDGDSGVSGSRMDRVALEAIPDALIVCDGEGVFAFGNSSFEVMFGWPSSEMVGTAVDDMFVPLESQGEACNLSQFIKGSEGAQRTVGIAQVLYAKHRLGGRIRAIVRMQSRSSGTGLVTCILVRDFLEEVRDRHTRVGSAIKSVGLL